MKGKINVLIVGSGGREHAIAWKIGQSPRIGQLYCAPGNPGTAELGENVYLKPTDITGLVEFALTHEIGLTIVGPELPLGLGIVDVFRAKDLAIFGPTKAAAELETSKYAAKKRMFSFGVPTASYQVIEHYDPHQPVPHPYKLPVVVKADGLAAGKGVRICLTHDEVRQAIHDFMVTKIHGAAGNVVIVEEYLEGPEVSVLALCDGKRALLMLPSQDHKRLLDGDQGPNTGGMGAFAPVPWVDAAMLSVIERTIIAPMLTGLAEERRPFTGCLYAGLMLTDAGPKVLEFNVRFGDPETQAILPLLKSDLLPVLYACALGDASGCTLEWEKRFCVSIVLASEGYPGECRTGLLIKRTSDIQDNFDNPIIFSAGTDRSCGQLVTHGGRVMAVSTVGDTLFAARQKAYSVVRRIHFDGMQYRTDIAKNA